MGISEMPRTPLNIEYIAVESLVPYARNSRLHSPWQVTQIADSIKLFGFTNPVLIDDANEIIAGHGRVLGAKEAGMAEVPCIRLGYLTPAEKRAYVIADNKLALNATWDEEMLEAELAALRELDFDISVVGFDEKELNDILNSGIEYEQNSPENFQVGRLAQQFGVPPFSVLNAREGWWQNRKQQWLTLGIKSEEGRSGIPTTTVMATDWAKRGKDAGGSVFDPVLCELIYSWFCPAGGTVLDPFAGGSVRGIVASKLGIKYVGVELREEQVKANFAQAGEIINAAPTPVWHCGDSREIKKLCEDVKANLIFSCPPYADLEVYSDDPRDISNLEYSKFKKEYFSIIKNTCTLLEDDSFACFVVGEVRDSSGNYYNFVGDTITAFLNSGLKFYNEAILVTPTGSLPIRTGRQFSAARKLGKTHQNILIFVKGDGKKATAKLGEVQFMEGVLQTVLADES